MTNEERVLTPQESLKIIQETIDLAKKGVQENGFHFLLWGWLVALCSLAEYYLRAIQGSESFPVVWMVMPLVGVPVAFIYEWRRDKQKMASNTVRAWYGQIWLAFAISLFAVLFLTLREGLSPTPYILVLAASATYISGIVLRFRPLLFGAAALWVGAVACGLTTDANHSLIMAAAIVLGYLVPGHMLNMLNKKNHAQ